MRLKCSRVGGIYGARKWCTSGTRGVRPCTIFRVRCTIGKVHPMVPHAYVLTKNKCVCTVVPKRTSDQKVQNFQNALLVVHSDLKFKLTL